MDFRVIFMTDVVVVAEIGDFSRFVSPNMSYLNTTQSDEETAESGVSDQSRH